MLLLVRLDAAFASLGDTYVINLMTQTMTLFPAGSCVSIPFSVSTFGRFRQLGRLCCRLCCASLPAPPPLISSHILPGHSLVQPHYSRLIIDVSVTSGDLQRLSPR